jgi:hypothetical protein
LAEIGERDTKLQIFAAATQALSAIYKAHKWFITRGDLDYTALWILYAATPLARIEMMTAGLLPDREAIPQASRVNPSLFRTIYSDLLNAKKTEKSITAALDILDGYMAGRAESFFGPVLDYLREAGEARSCTEIEAHFKRNIGVEGATSACEYLADRGLIGKVSTPVQLTRRSNVMVQELAFVMLTDVPNEF